MNKYEYAILASYKHSDMPYLDRLLNMWGEDGWELCHIDHARIVFKRLKPPSVEEIGNPDAV